MRNCRRAARRAQCRPCRRKPTGVMAITARGGGAITGLRMTEALGVAAVAGTSTAVVLATATPARRRAVISGAERQA